MGENEKMEWRRRENGFEDSASTTLLTLPTGSVNHNRHFTLLKKKKAKEKKKKIKRAYLHPKIKRVSQTKRNVPRNPSYCMAAR